MNFLEYCKKYNVRIIMTYYPWDDCYVYRFEYPNDIKQLFSFDARHRIEIGQFVNFETLLTDRAEKEYLANGGTS